VRRRAGRHVTLTNRVFTARSRSERRQAGGARGRHERHCRPAQPNVPQAVTLSSPREADTTDQTTSYQIEQTSGFPTLYSTDVFLATQIDKG